MSDAGSSVWEEGEDSSLAVGDSFPLELEEFRDLATCHSLAARIRHTLRYQSEDQAGACTVRFEAAHTLAAAEAEEDGAVGDAGSSGAADGDVEVAQVERTPVQACSHRTSCVRPYLRQEFVAHANETMRQEEVAQGPSGSTTKVKA